MDCKWVDCRLSFVSHWKELKDYPVLTESLIQDLAIKADENAQDIKDTLMITLLIIERLGETDDNVADFVEDLITNEFLSNDENGQIVKSFFSELESEKTRFFHFMRKEKAVERGASSLQRISMTAELKPVFNKEFKYGKDEIENYQPEIIGYVTTAQVQLGVSDKEEIFAFQVDTFLLNRLITDLLALQKEMKKLETVSHSLSEK
jgi:hypothetical protein